MKPLPQPDNRLYLGRGGSGKTTLALDHAGAAPRLLIVTPNDDEAPRLPVEIVTRDRRALIVAMMQPAFRVAFVPPRDDKGDMTPGWEWANEAALAAGDLVLFWEEAGRFMRNRPLPKFAYDAWMAGRHRRLRVVACSQRPASVSRDCTANVSRAVIFNTTEPDDLAWFRGMISKEGRDAIRGLDWDAHQALDWRPGASGYEIKQAPFT